MLALRNRRSFALALGLLGLLEPSLRGLPAAARTVLRAEPASVVLAPGQQVRIALAGAAGTLTASESSPTGAALPPASDPAVVTVDAATPALTVTARALGNIVVHVTDSSGATVDIPVTVFPAAGRVPQRVKVTVTGDPAMPDFLAAQIGAALDRAIRPTLLAGSTAQVTAILPQPEALPGGFLTTFTVPVRIDPAAGAAPVMGAATVDVQNAGLPAVRPTLLSFKDDPERITADGVLSRTTVGMTQPTRLYYYHENVGERRRFCVVLTANDRVVTHLQLLSAAAGPNVDVMSVGHAVTKSFLGLEPHAEGGVVEIWGGKPVIQRDTIAAPGDGIVGAVDLRVLDGGPVTVTVMAIPLDADPAAFLYGPKLPDDGHTRHGRFDLAGFAQRIIAYTAGGRDATYTYGSRQRTLPSTDPADPGRDYGDYGVLQRVAFDLANPSADPVRLYLYEKPLGGAVRSSFVVNGSLVDVGCVRVPQPYLIAHYDLAPHATGTFNVLTMTDGGSNYPLELGVTATPPLPAAPPIAAADGCFPKPGGPPAAPQPGTQPTRL